MRTKPKTKAVRKKAPQLMDRRENFYGDDGKPFVVYCPSCKLENHSMSVAAGQCAWCGWTARPRAKEY
jgi:ribosomal protein L37E